MTIQDDSEARLVSWVETTLGGKVVRFERQPRWRPAYFIDVERDGETIPLYFRGSRGPGGEDLIRMEGELVNVLEAEGIRVPHSYGYCADPPGILLTGVPGTEMFHHAPPEEQET